MPICSCMDLSRLPMSIRLSLSIFVSVSVCVRLSLSVCVCLSIIVCLSVSVFVCLCLSVPENQVTCKYVCISKLYTDIYTQASYTQISMHKKVTYTYV